MSYIFARCASQNTFARAEISRICARFPYLREISARAQVFGLAHCAQRVTKSSTSGHCLEPQAEGLAARQSWQPSCIYPGSNPPGSRSPLLFRYTDCTIDSDRIYAHKPLPGTLGRLSDR